MQERSETVRCCGAAKQRTSEQTLKSPNNCVAQKYCSAHANSVRQSLFLPRPLLCHIARADNPRRIASVIAYLGQQYRNLRIVERQQWDYHRDVGADDDERRPEDRQDEHAVMIREAVQPTNGCVGAKASKR